jgi:glutamate racemase
MKTTHRAPMTLGILDWGIGGLGFHQLLRARFPRGRVVYWSDSGTLPYGRLPANALAARVDFVARVMAGRGVTHLALACHAASSVLHLLPGERSGRPEITGIIEPGAAAIHSLRRPGLVGVLGGRRTIRSGVYRRLLDGLKIRQRIAQPLSAHVEAGDLDSVAVRRDLDIVMGPLRRVDTLLLACTHYPALAPAIQARAPRATIIDPAEAMLRSIERHWPIGRMSDGGDEFITTGDPKAMRRSARLAFGVRISGAIEVFRSL